MAYLDDLIKESKKRKKQELKKEVEELKPISKTKAAKEIKKVIEETKAAVEPELKKQEGVKELEIKGDKSTVATYGSVKIYKVKGEPLLIYSIPVIKPTGPEKIIVNTIREAATRLITVSPEEIRDPKRRRDFYFKRVKEIIESSPELGVPSAKIDFYADMVVREMIGYGVLDLLTKDDDLEEIMVTGPGRPVYVFHRQYDMMKTNIIFGTDDEIRNIISRIGRQVNRRVDTATPMLDARLPDGSRVNATIPPVSLAGATLTIRKFRSEPMTIVDLIKNNTLNAEVGALLWTAVDGLGAKPANVIVAGGASGGKTTTLNVLASFIPPRERIITIEDTAELNLPIEHWVRFETRPPGLEGTGEITMDVLLKNSLRMRPDRIIVGEIRHAEAFTMFSAMNTGHDGSLGTLHANSARETLVRLMNPPMSVPSMMISALNFIVMQHKIHDRRKGTIRRVTEIAEVLGIIEGNPQLQVLYEWEPATDVLKATGIPSNYEKELLKFSALSRNDLKLELQRRKELLTELANRNVTKMADIIKEVRKFGAANK